MNDEQHDTDFDEDISNKTPPEHPSILESLWLGMSLATVPFTIEVIRFIQYVGALLGEDISKRFIEMKAPPSFIERALEWWHQGKVFLSLSFVVLSIIALLYLPSVVTLLRWLRFGLNRITASR